MMHSCRRGSRAASSDRRADGPGDQRGGARERSGAGTGRRGARRTGTISLPCSTAGNAAAARTGTGTGVLLSH
jgi:hypothetical protein